MNDVSISREERAEKLQGMGCRRKRVEDIRFTQGKGQYVDDIKLPGMLFGDFVRSPYAHARIKSIDTSKAAAVMGSIVAWARKGTRYSASKTSSPRAASTSRTCWTIIANSPGSRLTLWSFPRASRFKVMCFSIIVAPSATALIAVTEVMV